jgi:cell division protein FtsN
MKTQLTQGRRPSQVNRNFGIAHLAMLILIALMFALAFSSCATSRETMPFANAQKYGKNPVKKNKPAAKQTAWIYRQWGHEGR